MKSARIRISKNQRQAEIVKVLSTSSGIRMPLLANKFGVTVETIRRDLDELAQEGHINRTYGGGVATQLVEAELTKRYSLLIQERQAIAIVAADSVSDRDTLMMGGGATTWHVAKELARRRNYLTVITHAIDIAVALSENPTHTVLFPPGQYSAEERLLYGTETIAYLKNYSVNKAILGASGVSTMGCSNAEVNAGHVYRTMATHSTEVLVVADHSKFGANSLFTYLHWADNVTLLSDQEPDEALTRTLDKNAARSFIVPTVAKI